MTVNAHCLFMVKATDVKRVMFRIILVQEKNKRGKRRG